MDAISYIQERFYQDYPPVSVCVRSTGDATHTHTHTHTHAHTHTHTHACTHTHSHTHTHTHTHMHAHTHTHTHTHSHTHTQHASEERYCFATPSTLKPTQVSCAEGSVNQIPPWTEIKGDIRLTPFYDIKECVEKVKGYIKEINDGGCGHCCSHAVIMLC